MTHAPDDTGPNEAPAEVDESTADQPAYSSDRTTSQAFRSLTAALQRRDPCLIVLIGPGVGTIHKLSQKRMTLGRSVDCDICLEAEGVSRLHAVVEEGANGRFSVVDNGSRNGCYIGGARVEQQELTDGDKVQLGSSCVLKFCYQDTIDIEFHRAQYDRATRDELTGVFNRAYFQDHVRREFVYAARHEEEAGLILFDADHFKRVNDTWGHPAGDMVLKKLADVVFKELRTEDILARVGGEEFAVYLRNQPRTQCSAIAERIRHAVEAAEFRWEGTRIPVTISMGVATRSEPGCDALEKIIATADMRLYAAKQGGRNRVVAERT